MVPNIKDREMNFWMSEELKQSNIFVIRQYQIKFNILRSNINKKLLFDSTISETNTCRIKVWGLLPLNKHTSFRIIIPAKVLWKYSITHIEKSITPSIRINIIRTDFRFYKNIKFLFLRGKLYSSLI